MTGWLGLDWGDVPTWVGSVSTGAALLIAAVSYRRSVHYGERSQANKVTVWVETVSDSEVISEVISKGISEVTSVVHLKNNSDGAVYFATIFVEEEPNERAPVNPYISHARDAVARWESLGPGCEETAEFQRTIGYPWVPWLYFQDADGVDWIRDFRAKLTRRNYG